MSDVIKINNSIKKLRAIIPEDGVDYSGLQTGYDEEQIRQEKLEQQYKLGYEEGKSSVKEELENLYRTDLLNKTEEFYTILSESEKKLKEYSEIFSKVVIGLSQRISEKIIKREIENKTIIEDTLSNAVSKIIGANEMTIKVNKSDYDYIVTEEVPIPYKNNFAKVKIEISDMVEKGGCLIETEIGNIDARVSTQINEIIRQFENKLFSDRQE